MYGWAYFEKQFPALMQALKNARKGGVLGHAHLVVSSNADYRIEFPTLLACLAACRDPKEDFSPCMECGNCRKLLQGIYPDSHTLSPTSKSREIVIGKDSEDIDTLRWFEALFHLSASGSSPWKIGTIQEADTMNEAAQNAFLKTLEEPPGQCLFVLTTGRMAKLLPTIRSRCQILHLTDNVCKYDFPRVSDVPEILTSLVAAGNGDLVAASDAANSLISISSNLYAGAEHEVSEKWKDRLAEAENLESAGLKLLEKRMEGETGSRYRRSREQYLSLIHTWCALLSLYTSGVPEEFLPNRELTAGMKKLAENVTQERGEKILDCAMELLSAMRTNVNDELALRTFCLKVAMKC